MAHCSIFLSVGTQLPFDRLVKMVEQFDNSNTSVEVTYQVGSNGYRPKGKKCFETVARLQFEQTLMKSDLFITHCGIGNIITSARYGITTFCCPREVEFSEHRNDHQLATAAAIEHAIPIFKNYDELAETFLLNGMEGVNDSRTSIVNKDFVYEIQSKIDFLLGTQGG